MADPELDTLAARRSGPDDHPGQWWLDGLLIAGASSEAEARAILDATAEPGDPAVSPSAVKAEAERRILAVMPEWKQRNALAAGQAAVMAHGSDPAMWPPELQAEHTAAMAAWAAINAIRASSDVLEAMDPIPADYAADYHWP